MDPPLAGPFEGHAKRWGNEIMGSSDILALSVQIAGALYGLHLGVKGVKCMFCHRIKTGLLYIVVGVPLATLLAGALLVPAVVCEVGPRPRSRCMLNLSQIGKASIMYAMDNNETLPVSFIQITNFAPDPKCYVCPRSGHEPGPLHLVDEWSDYILITNVSAGSDVGYITAYCKPENHTGEGCNVVFVDGSVMWVNRESFSNLTCDVEAHAAINTREPQPGRQGQDGRVRPRN